jgi:hypothetical protein
MRISNVPPRCYPPGYLTRADQSETGEFAILHDDRLNDLRSQNTAVQPKFFRHLPACRMRRLHSLHCATRQVPGIPVYRVD